MPDPVAKRLLSCVEGCGTFVERTPSIAPGSVWSRAAGRAAVAMSEANVPIDTIRKSFGVGWNTVLRAGSTLWPGRPGPPLAGRDR
jgi:hypothetical protein